MTGLPVTGAPAIDASALRFALRAARPSLLSGLLCCGFALAAPGAPQNAPMSGGAPPLPDAAPPAVARDIGVAELPLLVTEPPAAETEPEIPAPVTGGADSALNPFSPLLLPSPERTAEPPPPAQPPVAAEPPPSAPPAPSAAPTATAPAPEAAPVAPAPVPRARLSTPSIPAALGARMQPAATGTLRTGILGRTLGASSATTNPLAEAAAIRVPSSLAPPETLSATRGTLTPLGLAGGDGYATAAENRVSRSLRERRVAFTAMVTGTGIFRVGEGAAPVLMAVGDRLPGTDLVLSRLTSRSAQFTEDDARHTLSLNP